MTCSPLSAGRFPSAPVAGTPVASCFADLRPKSGLTRSPQAFRHFAHPGVVHALGQSAPDRARAGKILNAHRLVLVIVVDSLWCESRRAVFEMIEYERIRRFLF
ncbi:hypothetical protein GCM10029964_111610 [Kibdelosporangium lantanae]